MPRKVKVNSRTWKERYKELLEDLAPKIVQCVNCGSPATEMYICIWCKDPSGKTEEIE